MRFPAHILRDLRAEGFNDDVDVLEKFTQQVDAGSSSRLHVALLEERR